MVKGTSKRVVVVKSPDSRIFEQAIFIVREDFFSRHSEGGHSDILREAQAVADNYIRSTVLQPRRNTALPRVPTSVLLCLLAGVLALGVWASLHFLFGIL